MREVFNKHFLLSVLLVLITQTYCLHGTEDGRVSTVISTEQKLLLDAEKLLKSENTRSQAVKSLWKLSSLSESRKQDAKFASGCQALAILARISRNASGYEIVQHNSLLPPPKFLLDNKPPPDKDISKIAKALQGFDDYSLIGNWIYQKNDPGKYRNPRLMPFIESAYLKALAKSGGSDQAKTSSSGFREALKMLTYAESRTDGIDKAETLCQFGELLREIREFRRSGDYLKNALDYGNEWFKAQKSSENSSEVKSLPGINEWVKLKSRIEKLLCLLSFDLIEEDLGEAYAMYCKIREFYDQEDWWLAFPIAIKLKDEYPDTVYGEYARLAWCRMLLENDKAEGMKDKSLPSGIKELEKFISDKPFGFYCGEALMECGKFYLEYKWDSRQACFYYKKALEWFREVRNRKDSIDLFAKSADPDDKIKNQRVLSYSSPQGELSSLNQWNLTDYRKPASREIINHVTAPWYINEYEKECIFMVGFFLLEDGKFQEAGEYFSQVSSIDKDIALLERKNFPNALMRLKSCCKTGYIVLPAKDRQLLTPKNRLKTFLAEFRYILENFDTAETIYREIINDPKSKPVDQAAAYMGIGNCHDMIMEKQDSAAMFTKAYELSPKTEIGSESLYRLACNLQGNGKFDDSIKTFKKYLNEFPKGARAQNSFFNIVEIYDLTERRSLFEKHAASFIKKYPDTRQSEVLSAKINKNQDLNENKEE